MNTMSLNIFSSCCLLRTSRPSIGSLSVCRWNPTTASSSRLYATARPGASSRSSNRRKIPDRQKLRDDHRFEGENRALEKFANREWRAGDVYSPHDLSAEEMRKWKRRQGPSTDVFDTVDLNPLDLYKNFTVMSEYMTNMGRIKRRSETGLRPVNQRKIAKAVRRAIGLGLMPSVHRHPEILAGEAARSRMGTLE